MIIDERISMSLADKVDVWLDFLQEQSNDEEGIEYTRLVLEYGCSLVDYRYEIRKPNEANVDIEGIGGSYETVDRSDPPNIDYIDAFGSGERIVYTTYSNITGVRYLYEQNQIGVNRSGGEGWHYYDYSKIIKNKYTHFGWRYDTDVY